MNTNSNSSAQSTTLEKQCHNFCFKLPHEHGAVITLALSTALSIKLGLSLGLALLPLLGSIWLVFLLLHQQRLALWTGFVCSSFIGILFHSPLLALLVVLFSIGKSILNILSTNMGISWREAFGMLAVAASPLLLVTIASGNSLTAQSVALAYTASSILGTFLTHILRRDSLRSHGPTLILSLLLWLYLWAQEPIFFLWCLIPFAIQLTLLLKRKKPSFSQVGAIQTISLMFVSVFLLLQIP